LSDGIHLDTLYDEVPVSLVTWGLGWLLEKVLIQKKFVGKNMSESENGRKTFMVKSTPQIIEIIDSVFDLDSCLDRSKLIHWLLLPYIYDVIKSDQTEITDDRVYRRIEAIFNEYITGS